jgi:Asp-tRNA(Asn)/Glu-tRNA(Gln) amidotransferase A subunit family amidase
MAERTAVETARAVNAREISAMEIAEDMSARVRERDGAVGAYLARTKPSGSTRACARAKRCRSRAYRSP